MTPVVMMLAVSGGGEAEEPGADGAGSGRNPTVDTVEVGRRVAPAGSTGCSTGSHPPPRCDAGRHLRQPGAMAGAAGTARVPRTTWTPRPARRDTQVRRGTRVDTRRDAHGGRGMCDGRHARNEHGGLYGSGTGVGVRAGGFGNEARRGARRTVVVMSSTGTGPQATVCVQLVRSGKGEPWRVDEVRTVGTVVSLPEGSGKDTTASPRTAPASPASSPSPSARPE